jgi:hypothetical protein
MRRRARRLAVVLGGVVLLAGCGGGDGGAAGSASAADELRRAAQATLASRSFVIRVSVDGVGEERTSVYQAPDRVHIRGGPNDSEMISVGRTVYTRFRLPVGSTLAPDFPGPPPDVFQRFEAPAAGAGATDGVLAELRALADAPEVERDGAGFRWRSGSGRSAVSGAAHVAEGRIARFTFKPEAPEWTMAAATYRIDDYDAAPAVEPPPADRLVDAPAMTPCGPDGSPPPDQMMCSGVDLKQPTTTTTVALPAPTVTGRSPLELRRVLAVESPPCASLTAAFGAGEVRLHGPAGCYRLGTVLATIRRAQARPQSGPDGVTVSLDLGSSDGAAVRSALSGQYLRQVAMVMFGRVLSAPVVHDPESPVDSIAVSPVDPQTAANIVHSLR